MSGVHIVALGIVTGLAGCGSANSAANHEIDAFLVKNDAPPPGPSARDATLATKISPESWSPGEAQVKVSDPLPAADLSPLFATKDGEAPSFLSLAQPVGEPATAPSAAASQPSAEPTSQPAKRGYVPWQQRRGPAYPGDFWTSFGRDGKEILPTLWDDSVSTFTNPWVWVGLGAAGAAGITLSSCNVDDRIESHYTKHGSQLNTFWDSVGDAGGNPATHFAVMGAMYFTSLATNDTKGYETAKTLLNALILTDSSVIGLKVCAGTKSPNGDNDGWPSGHTASSFALATVLNDAYGPLVGVPLFLGASFVGYERIDARNHDFSDVISGALIGIAIGYGVSHNHEARIFGFQPVPWVSPENNAVGVALVKQF
jgi:acid phosphatase family membrane protein YuiD